MPPAAHIILEHVLIHIKSPKCSDIKMSSWSWLCNNSLMFSIHCSCLISEEDTAGRLYWGPVQPAPERTSLSFTIRICILGWNFGHILLYGFAQCRFCTRYIRGNFFWRNLDFGWLQTFKSMRWNFPKTSMYLHLSLVVAAIFYSTFSICFVNPLFWNWRSSW